jgi:putative endonuclease
VTRPIGDPRSARRDPGTAPSERGADDRRVAYRRGITAEALAAWSLRLKGYGILSRRFRAAGGEIDLVVRRGRLLVFVEVKARADFDEALQAVTHETSRRVAAAAEAFVARRPRYADFDQRFDIVLVVPRRWPRHVIDAWRPDR